MKKMNKIRIEPYGSLVYLPKTAVTIRLNQDETRKLLKYHGEFPSDLTAPEIVHCEISNRCNMNCKMCYVKDKNGKELSTEQWKRIFKDLAQNRIIQCTFGGGEPFMRDDIFELAAYVVRQGMNIAVTTNGSLIQDDKKLALFKQINFSVHKNLKELTTKIKTALKYTKAGINFVVSKSTLKELKSVASYCKKNGIELLLLSYKPVNGDIKEVIEPLAIMRIAIHLAMTDVQVAVDGMTCSKCFASRRFVDIDSVGNVYPCSFIRKSLGNVLKQPFKQIWQNRSIPKMCPYGEKRSR